jgi:hypothetical protein
MIEDPEWKALAKGQFNDGNEFRAYFKSLLVTEFNKLFYELDSKLTWDRYQYMVKRRPAHERVAVTLKRTFRDSLNAGFTNDSSREHADRIIKLLEFYKANSRNWQ